MPENSSVHGARRARRQRSDATTARWSQHVTRTSNALDLDQGVFSLDDPRAIARSLKRSAERSSRRKATPFRSAMSMLIFYVNRAGKGLSAERRHTRIVGVDGPQCREHGGGRRHRGTVGPGQAVPERLQEIVLLGPDQLQGRRWVGTERRLVVCQPEISCPSQEPVDHPVGLAGRLPLRRAELAHGLQHLEARARRGVDHLDQRLVDEVLDNGVVVE